MARPANGYWLSVDGKKTRVPSVTTVLKQLGWSSGGLMYWAWREGFEGRTIEEARQAAADIGTIVHAMVEADLHGEGPPDLSALPEPMAHSCATAYEGWLRWKEQHHVADVKSELSLISREHLFGGTMDQLRTDGELSVLDLKTSAGLYPDHLCQIAAYGKLAEENCHGTAARYHVLRISREDGSLHHHEWPANSMAPAWEAFLCARRLYDLERTLKRVA
jgi:hypothetical protein